MKKLDVYLGREAGNERRIGQLAEADHRVYFEYDASFLEEGQAPATEHILRVADEAGITRRRARDIIDEVSTAVAGWPQFAKQAGLPSGTARTLAKSFC